AMRAIAVGDDVALAGACRERAAVAELGHELALEHVDHVAALAPVVGDVPGRVLDHARSHVPDLERAPRCFAGSTGMKRRHERRPVDRLKWNFLELHAASMPSRPWGVVPRPRKRGACYKRECRSSRLSSTLYRSACSSSTTAERSRTRTYARTSSSIAS